MSDKIATGLTLVRNFFFAAPAGNREEGSVSLEQVIITVALIAGALVVVGAIGAAISSRVTGIY